MKMCSIPNDEYVNLFLCYTNCVRFSRKRISLEKECIRNNAILHMQNHWESSKSIRSAWRMLIFFFRERVRGGNVGVGRGLRLFIRLLLVVVVDVFSSLASVYAHIKSNFAKLFCVARVHRSLWKITTKYFIRSLAHSAIYSSVVTSCVSGKQIDLAQVNLNFSYKKGRARKKCCDRIRTKEEKNRRRESLERARKMEEEDEEINGESYSWQGCRIMFIFIIIILVAK